MLNLSISSTQKSDGIFVADQTPTPTRLIKNCEEVGLFDDLQHVNPFDETFQRAVEAVKAGQTPTTLSEASQLDELHTPQVFPQLEDDVDGGGFRTCQQKSLEDPTSAAVTLDVPDVTDLQLYKAATVRQNSDNSASSVGFSGRHNKYRLIAEKPSQQTFVSADSADSGTTSLGPMPVSIQLVQPQVITLSFPAHSESSSVTSTTKPLGSHLSTAVPVQTVKPFILPRVLDCNAKEQDSHLSNFTGTPTIAPTPAHPVHEPSSASLTPTSQLPIKERLKAILHHNSKSRIVELPQRSRTRKCHQRGDEECAERRRAAATRYRVKMRTEHKELRQQNEQLQRDNEVLRSRVRQLEQQLAAQQTAGVQPFIDSGSISGATPAVPAQIQIPASTVHLVMNIPRLVVPSNGQPVLQNSITYHVEKK